MCRFLSIVLLVIIISIPISAIAEQGDIKVGEVGISNLKWGQQNVSIELENKTEAPKFIITTTDLTFEGLYENPEFNVKTIYILEPLQKITLKPELFIPGNYGTVTIKLDIYDVVDTLDALMPWHKFYEQPFILKFNPSDEILPYLQEKVTFPPRVDEHPYFNNEFVRLLFTLLLEGKTVEEIASMNKCDVDFVKNKIEFYLKENFLVAVDNSYVTTFPFISREEAIDARKIADTFSDNLAALITKNMSSYFAVVDSLADAKTIPRDSNDFISGASLVYKPTPFVSAFVLWFELGKKFITREAPLLIYNATDICNAKIPQYMYMVDGGPYFNGSQFFGFFDGKDSYSLMFSENHLQVICNEDFQLTPAKRSGIWKYDMGKLPEFFIADTTFARPLINLLTKGSEEMLKEAYEDLRKNALTHGQKKLYIGHRYWFWNLTATLTLDKLFKNGTLKKRENDFFRYDKVKDKGLR